MNENSIKAFNLKVKGFTFADIAARLKCTYEEATLLVDEGKTAELKKQVALEEARIEQLAHLNLLIFQCYLDIENSVDIISDEGKLYRDGIKSRGLITQTLLKLLQEKAKLLGLNAPTKITQQVTQSIDLDGNIEQLSLTELEELFANKVR